MVGALSPTPETKWPRPIHTEILALLTTPHVSHMFELPSSLQEQGAPTQTAGFGLKQKNREPIQIIVGQSQSQLHLHCSFAFWGIVEAHSRKDTM